jgi:hypothetical protein
MSEISLKPIASQNPLLFGVGFAALSLLAHVLFVGWVGGALEIPSWNPPLIDTPIEVTLAQTAPAANKESIPVSQPSREIAKSIRKPLNVTKAAPKKLSEPNGDVIKAERELEPERAIDTGSDSKTELPAKEEANVEVAAEPPPEPVKPKAEIVEQAQFPNGLGVIPVAGAFPYTFYLGDYSLNNALGSGSFIVESGEGKYKLVLIGKASGLTSLIFSGVIYRSEGSFGNDGFAPQLYAEKSGNRAERAAQVDYAAKEVTLGEQKKPTLLGMQDRVSVIWQVGLILRAKPEYSERGKTLPIPLMSTRSLDNAQFISQGIVDFDKRGSLVKAVHFKFKPANPLNKAQIDLWYDLSNLPQPLRVRWIDERERTIDIFRDE